MESKPTRPRSRRGAGSVYKPKGSRFWWIAYMSGGKRHFESSESEIKGKAVALLAQKLGDTAHGKVVTPNIGRKTIKQGLDSVVDDLTINGRKSAHEVAAIIKMHMLAYFRPDRRMSDISTSDLKAYVKHRMEQGASPATCNNELATIRRAYRLAVRAGELASMPYIPML